MVLDQLRLQDA